MYKYLPSKNLVALKSSINKAIDENNISSNKVSKAMQIDTSQFKLMRDVNNEKIEISPAQYLSLKEFFRIKKAELSLGEEPENYYDRFMFYLFRKGMDITEFCKKTGIPKNKINSLFKDNFISFYKDRVLRVLTIEEYNNLNSYNTLELSGDRNAKLIRGINSSTLINIFMKKRGYQVKDLALKMHSSEEQVKSILGGFILDSTIIKVAEALNLSEKCIDKVVLNSWDVENNFGYFLQKLIYNKKENVYSFGKRINFKYEDLKGIVSGTRNIREDEFEVLAKALNLDINELRANAPKIIEGDDKFIPWNFVKWMDKNQNVIYKDIDNIIGKDSAALCTRIKTGKSYKLPDISVLMTVTGLSKEELRSVLSDEEIEQIKSVKRKSGRKNNIDPNSFNAFVRNKIEEKGLGYSEYTKLINVERTTFSTMLKQNKLRSDLVSILNNTLDITDKDLKKFNVEIFEVRVTSKKKEKTMTMEELEKLCIEEPKFEGGYKSEGEEVIEFKDESSVIPDMITEVEFQPSEEAKKTFENMKKTQPSSLHGSFSSLDDEAKDALGIIKENEFDNKEVLMKLLDNFLGIFENLNEEDQKIVLKIMIIIKYPDDVFFKNIPDGCFEDNRFSSYKKMDTIIKLTGLKV